MLFDGLCKLLEGNFAVLFTASINVVKYSLNLRLIGKPIFFEECLKLLNINISTSVRIDNFESFSNAGLDSQF